MNSGVVVSNGTPSILIRARTRCKGVLIAHACGTTVSCQLTYAQERSIAGPPATLGHYHPFGDPENPAVKQKSREAPNFAS